MSAHEFHHCEHTPLGPPPIDTAEQIRQATAEGEKVGAMLSEHLRTTPTPIDPADIRPGDTFRLTHEATCERIDEVGNIVSTLGDVFAPVTVEGMAWYLVSRPDPDAEVVEALEDRVTAAVNDWRKLEGAEWRLPNFHAERIVAHVMASIAPAALREQGWDVVRRAEP